MSILRLTAVLEDVTPRVSRILMVPSDLRLDRLHLVLQAAMGWENQHLYSFEAGSRRWSLPDPHLRLDALPANKATLQQALVAAGHTSLVYTYDFGDDWRHHLTGELTDGPLPGQLYPRLVEAEGRCPPEVGNVYTYIDDNHITATYVRTAQAFFDERFETARRTADAAQRIDG